MRVKALIIILFGISCLSFANEKLILRSIAPTELKHINWLQVEQFKIYQKALGKVSLQEGSHYYYERKGIKYPISLEKNKQNEKLTRLYFRVLGQKIQFNDLKTYFNDHKFVEEIRPGAKGNFKIFTSQKEKIKFKFTTSNQKLYSVEKWY